MLVARNMETEVTIQFPYTAETFAPAYRVNLRRKKTSYLLPVFGAGLIALNLYIVFTGPENWALPVLGFLAGGMCLFQNRIAVHNSCRWMKKNKSYGDTITARFSPQGVTSSSSGTDGSMSWDKILSATFCREGVLLFTHEGIFHFAPRNAFANEEDFGAVKTMIADAGVKIEKVGR